MIREVTRGNWTNEDYILYAMETIMCDLDDSYQKGQLKDFINDCDEVEVRKDKNGKVETVNLKIWTETYVIAIYTDMRMLSGQGRIFTEADGIEEYAKIKSFICEAINDLYR